MTEEAWRIQVSPKTPSGTLINVRGNTAEEVQELLAGVQELVVLIIGLEQSLGGVHTLAPLSTGGFTQTPSEVPSLNTGFPSTPPHPAVVPVTPATAGPTCLHGQRLFKSGAKNGKSWSGWSCPAPRDQQCAMEWSK